MWQEKVNKKTVLALLLLQCASPICFYFTYIHCGTILKINFNYTTAEVIHHNFIVCIIQLLIVLIATYLSYKVYPLLIIKVVLILFSIFMLFCPYWFNNIHSPLELLLIQSFILLFWQCDAPATPIFYKSFPVFKRFTCASMTFTVSRALMYAITAFGFAYITEHFGHWGLWIIMVPTIVGFAYGFFHFEKLAKELGGYPIGHKDLFVYKETTI
ncbi:MFS transporter [Candidatus Tisiphia endosymbiont of Hybos culiciformis]|uniref:MFS transporter n=1 Tax=Candidatus Tisiphia endosymbiont of Hybos culiciformis TaxID=3139331 RepID=UPI003CCA9330